MNKSLKIFLLTAIAIFALTIVTYSVLKIISVDRMLNSFEKDYANSPSFQKQPIEFSGSDSSSKEIFMQFAYYNALLEASKSDSISLVLDIKDSIASLLIKGVTVHKAHIDKIKISPLFKAVEPKILYNALSSPFIIANQKSSIPKRPLMVKIAPRDTSEYVPDIIPDTTDITPVNFTLETSTGIIIRIFEMPPSSKTVINLTHFVKEETRAIFRDLPKIVTLKVPEYHPYIYLKMDRKDAKMIYRAIPQKALVVIKIE